MITPEIISFANHLADISATVITKYFRSNISEETKNNQTPVTKADKETEEVIRQAIEKKFPQHGIVGEEFQNTNDKADYKWIIDPIDGTVSFIMGRPIFGTLIALSYKDKPILGIINQPITKERWCGIADQNATLNGKIIKTSDCKNIQDAILCSTSPHFFKGNDSIRLQRISSQTKYQSQGGIMYGGDCYLFGLLALGSVDIIIEQGLEIHDFMALNQIVKSAGGVITTWEGKELDMNSNGTIIACATQELYDKVMDDF
jgi:histidinol phosphatase-like enzyme (inositol monophosphatase family)